MAQDNDDCPDELPREEVKKLSGLVPDLVRRAVLTGVGALFMTEEGLRNLVGEMKLPKDALAFLLAQADRTRSEAVRVVTQEVRRFLERETLRRGHSEERHTGTAGADAHHPHQPPGRPHLQPPPPPPRPRRPPPPPP